MALPWQSPSFVSDPYSIYHHLRTADPVHFEANSWVLSRYADIAAVLKDGRFGFPEVAVTTGEPAHPLPSDVGNGPLRQIMIKGWQLNDPWTIWLGTRNPPHHTRLRAALAMHFSPASVARLRPRIQAATDALLDRVEDAGEMDVIADLADPLPTRVIAEVIGLPPVDSARLKAWSSAMLTELFGQPNQADFQWSLLARAAFADYLRPLLARRRLEPQDDLMSLLLQAEAEGKQTAEEVTANCMTFFIAGQETTSATLGNALLAMLRHPEQLQRLRDEPELMAAAIEEFFRYDAPAQLIWRTALTDVELHGCSLRKDQRLLLLMGAGNRDPAAFAEPDRLALDRAPNPHLSFSQGIHYCLGAHLARLETQIVLSTVLERLPRLALQDRPLEWQSTWRVRGLKSLPVRF